MISRIIGIAVLMLAGIIGVCFKKSKLITKILFMYMWVLIALNTESPDFENYRIIYENCVSQRISYEPIFMLLTNICLNLGFTYFQFRLVVASLFIAFLAKAFKKYEYIDNRTLALFLFFPFFGFISSIRAGVATAILIYAFTFVLDENNQRDKFRIWKYIGMVLFAGGFSYFALFFLVYPILRKIPRKVILSFFPVCFFIIVFFKNGTIYNLFRLITDDYRILHWFKVDELRIMKTWVVCVMGGIQALYYGLVWYAGRNVTKNTYKKTYDNWLTLNALIMCIIPLYYIQTVFSRIFEATIFVDIYMVYTSTASLFKRPDYDLNISNDVGNGSVLKIKKIELYLLVLTLIAFVWYAGVIQSDYFMMDLYGNNLIFEFL